MVTYCFDRPIPLKQPLGNYFGKVMFSQSQIITNRHEDSMDVFDYSFPANIRGETVNLNICFYVDKDVIRKVQLIAVSDAINEYDLDGYFHKLLSSVLLPLQSTPQNKYVIRHYFLTYLSKYIRGGFSFNYDGKVFVKSLSTKDHPTETMNEQVLAIDLEIQAESFEEARALAYNKGRDIQALLSVLLNIACMDIQSKRQFFFQRQGDFINCGRFRTGYIDPELDLFVRDNFNELKTRADAMNGTPFPGVTSVSPLDDKLRPKSTTFIQNSSYENLEKVFSQHKITKKVNDNDIFSETISRDIHYLNVLVQMPRQFRQFFSTVANLKESEKKFFIAFARLYNLATSADIWGEPTMAISYFVSSVETLAKTEGSSVGFSQFIKKYYPGCNVKLLDYMYGSVRSGHFHSGEFHFLEYGISYHGIMQNHRLEKLQQIFDFKLILRNAIVAKIEACMKGCSS